MYDMRDFFDLRSGFTADSAEDWKTPERGDISISPEFVQIREPLCQKITLLRLR
jgi:hypothetical protein